jgi:hypothetical protein
MTNPLTPAARARDAAHEYAAYPGYPRIADPAIRDAFEAGQAWEHERLMPLLIALADPDPCEYDHNDLCQAHSLHSRPCPHEEAKRLIGDADDAPPPPRRVPETADSNPSEDGTWSADNPRPRR